MKVKMKGVMNEKKRKEVIEIWNLCLPRFSLHCNLCFRRCLWVLLKLSREEERDMREQSNFKWPRPLYPLRKPVFCGGVAVVEEGAAMVKRRCLSSSSSSSSSSACTHFTGKTEHREFSGLLICGVFSVCLLSIYLCSPFVYSFLVDFLYSMYGAVFALFLPFSIRWLSFVSLTLSITGFKLKSITWCASAIVKA